MLASLSSGKLIYDCYHEMGKVLQSWHGKTSYMGGVVYGSC